MTNDQKLYIWGEGVAFADGERLDEIQEVGISFGLNTIQDNAGDGGGNIVVNTGQPLTGRIVMAALDPAALAILTGGSNATGTVKRKRPTSVAKSTNTVTIPDATYIANTLTVLPEGSNKAPLKLVTSAPAVGEYSVSGTTITLNASQTETNFYLDYFYTSTSDGLTLSLDPNDLPDEFELYASMRAKDLFPGTKGDVIIYAAKCSRTSELSLGPSVGASAKPGFDFSIRRDSADDWKMYFPAT